ncbi:MAG: thiamine pyrophosphate-dependent dehydrogenase E1 component subunit alpha [Sphingomicrobium sp.]
MADRDPGKVSADVDWREVARLVLTSREMDRIEEQELVPAKKVLYQFSARGHDMAQVLLGLQLKDGDGVFGYYRSRPLLLALGVPLADALGSGMGLAGGYSDGRDIGVVFNYPNPGGAHALPMCGGVGAQYTPAAGWAQAIAYKTKVLNEGPEDALALVLGGDASCATGGFWSALTIATTQQLPLVIYIEDNGYGISVPSEYQTPGKDIAANLASFSGLTIFNGDGTDPAEASKLVHAAVQHVRTRRAPALLRLTVPRLEGHSAQDTQAYKTEAEIAAEWSRDPLPRLKAHVAKLQIGSDQWSSLEQETAWQVQAAVAEAEARGIASPETVTRHVIEERELQQVGG